jgi:hypothetical protein
VYDLDPTKTDRLWMVESEVSGAGPRPFEADQRLQQTLYQLDIARPFERWTVLARTAGAPRTIAFVDLGLDPAKEYVAFDFWANGAVGLFKGALNLGPVADNDVQVLCLRERVGHPQLLATNRHVSCGGVDLQDVQWNGNVLSGVTRGVIEGIGMLYVTEPAGWESVSVEATDARARLGELLEATSANGIRWRRVVIAGPAPSIAWKIQYRHIP